MNVPDILLLVPGNHQNQNQQYTSEITVWHIANSAPQSKNFVMNNSFTEQDREEDEAL